MSPFSETPVFSSSGPQQVTRNLFRCPSTQYSGAIYRSASLRSLSFLLCGDSRPPFASELKEEKLEIFLLYIFLLILFSLNR